MASSFLYQLLHSLSGSIYRALPLPGRVASCQIREVANLLLGLVHHSGDCTGGHCQGVLDGLGSRLSRATMPGGGAMRGGGLAGCH